VDVWSRKKSAHVIKSGMNDINRFVSFLIVILLVHVSQAGMANSAGRLRAWQEGVEEEDIISYKKIFSTEQIFLQHFFQGY
jgi:hypothetical protein